MDDTDPPRAERISERGAARLLAEIGLSRRRAQRVLAAGLAGEPVRSASAILYDAGRVRRLLAVETISEAVLHEFFPRGVFVARREFTNGLVATDLDGAAMRSELSRPWDISPLTAVLVSHALAEDGPLPLLATVCGFVVAGADLLAIQPAGALTLQEPGAWSARFAATRILTGPGRPWTLHGWQDGLSPKAVAERSAAAQRLWASGQEQRRQVRRALVARRVDLGPRCGDPNCPEPGCAEADVS